jgi:hypothetical protein
MRDTGEPQECDRRRDRMKETITWRRGVPDGYGRYLALVRWRGAERVMVLERVIDHGWGDYWQSGHETRWAVLAWAEVPKGPASVSRSKAGGASPPDGWDSGPGYSGEAEPEGWGGGGRRRKTTDGRK